MLLYNANAAEFTRLRSLGDRNPRLETYARAMEDLHAEPRDEAKVELSRQLLSRLVEAGAGDAIESAARYYLARIVHQHQSQPDHAEARAAYLEFYKGSRDSFFAQLSFLKYVTLYLYDSLDDRKTSLEKLQEIEALASGMSVPELKANFHRMMGQAYEAFDLLPSRALEHFALAYAIGFRIDENRLETLHALARLSERLGRPEDARRFYRELLAMELPQEVREEAWAALSRLGS